MPTYTQTKKYLNVAVSKDKTRPKIMKPFAIDVPNPWCDWMGDKAVCATDGHRMHIASFASLDLPESIEAGTYFSREIEPVSYDHQPPAVRSYLKMKDPNGPALATISAEQIEPYAKVPKGPAAFLGEDSFYVAPRPIRGIEWASVLEAKYFGESVPSKQTGVDVCILRPENTATPEHPDLGPIYLYPTHESKIHAWMSIIMPRRV